MIYLLDLFCNSKTPEAREAAVELLARMMADKLHGPKVIIILWTALAIVGKLIYCFYYYITNIFLFFFTYLVSMYIDNNDLVS